MPEPVKITMFFIKPILILYETKVQRNMENLKESSTWAVFDFFIIFQYG